ncbi:MAG: ATPase [Streptosporangiales bacterium]|nr:ATPase [Streptosporangiales bacterium]
MRVARRLVIDLGQTGSRLVLDGLADSDGPDGDRLRLTGPGHRAGEAVADSVAASVAAALAAGEVALGLTGLHGTAPDAATIAERLRGRVTFERLVAADDSVTAYLGALGPRPGVVTIAGTGAVALAADGRGHSAHVDGWGCYLGDDGGGYWVGRRGLAAAFRALDGRGGSGALLAALRRREGADPRRLPPRLAADPDRVAAVAGFAVEVVAAAADGDATAAAILTEAGEELALAAETAARRAGLVAPVEVALVGRLAAGARPLVAAFERRLRARRPEITGVAVYADVAATAGAEQLLDSGAYALFPDLVAVAGPA